MCSQPKYRGLHRRQVFHWIAAPSDRANGLSGKLTPAVRGEYLQFLRGSLSDGLWLKSPRDPEVLGLREYSLKLERPIACFTEWSLEDSAHHTRSYGRLGLGFPKSWLLQCGGQPVTYFDQSRRGAFLKSALRLLRDLKGHPHLREELLFLLHFAKRIQRPKPPPKPTAPKPPRSKGRPDAPRSRDPYTRFWSKTMPYLEEREWRIVVGEGAPSRLGLRPGPPGADPEYFLPYIPGKELFTLVLPDNETVSRVLQDDDLRSRLFPANAPHVTVLSLQDVGTF